MMDADAELLDRAVSGDEEALSDLLMLHGPAVRLRLEGKVAHQWRAVLTEDDVMQVTYLEAFLRIRQFRPAGEGAFRAWLARIAENNLRDATKELSRLKRPQPRDRVQSRDADSGAALLELVGITTATPSRAAAGKEAVSLMKRALAQLPPDYRRVIELYDLEGRPVNEVAESMERSTGAIYMLRARAHDQLRGQLGTESHFFSRPA